MTLRHAQGPVASENPVDLDRQNPEAEIAARAAVCRNPVAIL